MTKTLISVISFSAVLGHQLSPETHHQTSPSLISCVGFEMDAKGPSHNVPILGHGLLHRGQEAGSSTTQGKGGFQRLKETTPKPQEPPVLQGIS